ncbi:MAG: patatin-like phospholipase family protein [Bacillota bacterium]
MSRKRIGLALSGGAAKGLVHVGVIKGLLHLGVPVDCIAGTSAGSLVGALVAAAMTPEEIEKLARATRWRDVVRPVLPRAGLLDSTRLERFLQTHLGGRVIEDLAIPYAAVACDLRTGRRVTITRGPLARAVRASCAVPGIFRPVEIDGRLLVDGGVCCNVPTAVPRELGADFVIAVDLSGDLGSAPARWNIFAVMLRSWEIMQREKRAAEVSGADVLIRPPVAGLSLIDLDSVDDYVRVGWEAALAHREALADLMEKAADRSLFYYLNPRQWTRRGSSGRRSSGRRAGRTAGGSDPPPGRREPPLA